MDAISKEQDDAVHANQEPALGWDKFSQFVLLALALCGGYVLIDMYSHGQAISKYLLRGALAAAVIVLMRLAR